MSDDLDLSFWIVKTKVIPEAELGVHAQCLVPTTRHHPNKLVLEWDAIPRAVKWQRAQLSKIQERKANLCSSISKIVEK